MSIDNIAAGILLTKKAIPEPFLCDVRIKRIIESRELTGNSTTHLPITLPSNGLEIER